MYVDSSSRVLIRLTPVTTAVYFLLNMKCSPIFWENVNNKCETQPTKEHVIFSKKKTLP